MKYVDTLFKILQRNAPAVLTGIGAAGVVSTAVLTAKATLKANNMYHDDPVFLQEMTKVEKARILGPFFIPPLLTATLSICCIVSAHSLNVRKQVALASLYTITEKSFLEFRDSVSNEFGQAKVDRIRDGLIGEQAEEAKANSSELVYLAGSEVLCMDQFSGRLFKSTAEDIRRAENDINRQCINDMYASLNDFYRLVGLPSITLGDELGWNTDNPIKIRFVSAISEGTKPVLALDFDRNKPKPNFYKVF